MHSQLFESALGISDTWFVNGIDFDVTAKRLTVNIDVVAGSRFPHPKIASGYPMHDTVVKRYRHLNLFQHDCFLEVRTSHLNLPDGYVALVEPPICMGSGPN